MNIFFSNSTALGIKRIKRVYMGFSGRVQPILINLRTEIAQLPNLFFYVLDTKLNLKVCFIKVHGEIFLLI